jgi:hypothetical protein
MRRLIDRLEDQLLALEDQRRRGDFTKREFEEARREILEELERADREAEPANGVRER